MLPQQPQQGTVSEGTVRRLVEEARKEETSHYHSLLIAIIVLGLLIIAGLVVGFIIIGLQTNDIDNIHSEVNDIWKALQKQQEQIDFLINYTEQIKANLTDFPDEVTNATLVALEEFFPRPLPLTRTLCAHEQDVPIPADAYVLLSSNLTNTESFPFTSVLYSFKSGVIEIDAPNLQDDETVIISFNIRVFITQIPTDGIYSLALTTSTNCEYDNCPSSFLSVTKRYVSDNPEWGVGNLWMFLEGSYPAQNGQRYFLFVGSKGGGGIVPGTAQEGVSTCAALSISLNSIMPASLSP